MISICIPVYNYDAVPLVRSLAAQAGEVEGGAELVCIDDCSSAEWRQRNVSLSELGRYVELEENVGRARIRNMFLDYAQGDYLLFLDVDSEVGEGFLRRYAEALREQPAVVVGGRVYDKRGNNPAHRLRYLYGTQVESKSAAWRTAHPYHSFMSNNFVVSRDVLQRIPFDEDVVRYGHEDTLFGYRLEQNGIPILHIDNPVVNGEVESNADFLAKTREGVVSLSEIDRKLRGEPMFRQRVRLLDAYDRLCRWHLTAPVKWLYLLLRRPLESHFLAGESISVTQLNFYKLGYLIQSIHTH